MIQVRQLDQHINRDINFSKLIFGICGLCDADLLSNFPLLPVMIFPQIPNPLKRHIITPFYFSIVVI